MKDKNKDELNLRLKEPALLPEDVYIDSIARCLVCLFGIYEKLFDLLIIAPIKFIYLICKLIVGEKIEKFLIDKKRILSVFLVIVFSIISFSIYGNHPVIATCLIFFSSVPIIMMMQKNELICYLYRILESSLVTLILIYGVTLSIFTIFQGIMIKCGYLKSFNNFEAEGGAMMWAFSITSIVAVRPAFYLIRSYMQSYHKKWELWKIGTYPLITYVIQILLLVSMLNSHLLEVGEKFFLEANKEFLDQVSVKISFLLVLLGVITQLIYLCLAEYSVNKEYKKSLLENKEY